MLIDGKQIAEELRVKLLSAAHSLTRQPSLGIVVVGENPVIESFVRIKKKYGASIGVNIIEVRFSEKITTEELIGAVRDASLRSDIDGLIIQLPLPAGINTQAVLDVVPTAKDVDMLAASSTTAFARGEAKIFPPVAAAVQEILERYNINVEGMEVLVLGHGRLVGIPVSLLLRHNHAHVTVIDKPVRDLAEHVHDSAIVICGVGMPGLITKEMLGPNTILIDAGTSESAGKVVGDVDPKCAEVARLMTPVPGGVGPIAVAMLFRNLILLAREQNEKG